MADRVKAVATEEALHFKELAEEAARSGAYFYPFKVITYLLSKIYIYIYFSSVMTKSFNYSLRGSFIFSATTIYGNLYFHGSVQRLHWAWESLT